MDSDNPLLANWQNLQNSLADFVANNLAEIRENGIENNLANNTDINSNPKPPEILAVSKGQSVDKIRALMSFGQKSFGESYLQEAQSKIAALSQYNPQDIQWHFIGKIQSRKAKEIGKTFAWVHTVSSIENAEKISQGAMSVGKNINVLIQINTSGEVSKGGIDIDNEAEVFSVVEKINSLPSLSLRGLMCIPAPTNDFSQQKKPFAALTRLLKKIKLQYPQIAKNLDSLSMGMSDDYQAAIIEGATIIRIGTMLLGERDYGNTQNN